MMPFANTYRVDPHFHYTDMDFEQERTRSYRELTPFSYAEFGAKLGKKKKIFSKINSSKLIINIFLEIKF